MLSRFERFVVDITEIDLYWHRLATAVMKPFGLKGSYVIYFTRLYRSEEGMTAVELARLCGKDKADISRDISSLEEAGLVEKRRAKGSAYKARIALTKEGCRITEEIIRKAELAVERVGSDLSEENREIFYAVLDRITENLQMLSETGFPETEDPGKNKDRSREA